MFFFLNCLADSNNCCIFAAVNQKCNSMARTLRSKSETGIYHVMMRGVNHQIIFEQPRDYVRFLELLNQMVHPADEQNHPLPPNCSVYAYCLMPNHVHILLKEEYTELSSVVKRISAAYALYYNKKYERVGHLFQDRFKSENVNDASYFFTLIRYIHQNPVAAGLSEDVAGYPWSSWREYEGGSRISICKTSPVLLRMSLAELRELVNEPLSKTVRVLDYDKSNCFATDSEVRDYLTERYGLRTPADIQLLSRDRRDEILHNIKEFGASIRQLERLTGVGFSIIRRA